ncbi:MAG TPA: DNA polymerase Y family protein, partial [Allosphingosinicella sp.]|nr:DNA polymerase Y family protein [Allosphingosinicella sp.]
MPRVASLYLPNLSTERVRRDERPDRSSPSSLGEGDHAQHGGGAAEAKPEPSSSLRSAPPPRRFASRSPSPSELGEDLPLLLSHRVGSRVLIAAASPEAQALGLHPGMAVTQARALVPGLDVRDADPEGDAALLTRLALYAARRWTPRASVSPPDGLFLDLSGAAHLFGGEEKMARRLVAFCARAGFTARIAVAGTPGAAHALARFAADPLLLCPPAGETEALAPLPLAALRVEESVLAAAARLGLTTIRELLPLPRGPLQRRFGRTLLLRLDQALGRAGEALEPVVPAEPPAATLRLLEPIATAEAIGEALRLLMARLIETLAKAGLAARTLALLCERVDGRVERISIGTARPTRDGDHLLRLLSMRIETIEPGFGIETMRLVAGRAEPLAPEQLSGEKAAEDIAPLVDRLAGRLGGRRVYRATA